MKNYMKVHQMRIEFYKAILEFFTTQKHDEVEFWVPIMFDVDEGVTSNLLTSVNVKSINKEGDMVATYVDNEDETLIRLTELNVIQLANILDELQKGRYEVLKEQETE